MALAVILLTGAALMIRTFVGLRSAQPGFDAHNVITMQTSLTGGKHDTTAKVENMIRQVILRIEALPGVQSAAATIMLPIEGGIDLPFIIDGRPLDKGNRFMATNNGGSEARTIFRLQDSAVARARLR